MLPCVSDTPELSAVFCVIQLMVDLWRDTSSELTNDEFAGKDALIVTNLKKAAADVSKTRASSALTYQQALCEVSDRCVDNNLLRNPYYCRIDRKSDWTKRIKPHFSNRLFRWVLACLRAKHPVLISCPLITKEALSESMLDTDRAIEFPSVNYPQMYVPAVAYEATTTIIEGEHLPVYQHGVRCRMFLPNKECSFRTIPSYFFRGWVKDCWLLTDPNWLDCLDIET